MEYVIIIIAGLIFYSPTLFFKFSVDDYRCYLTTKNKSGHIYPFKDVRSFKRLMHFIRSRLYGSGTIQCLPLDHLATTVIHTIVSCLIFKAFQNLPAAIMFLIHPATNQVSVWTNGKRYAIAAAAVLILWAFQPYGIIAMLAVPFFHATGLVAPALYLFTPYKWVLLACVLLFLPGYRTMRDWYVARRRTIRSSALTQWRPHKLVVCVKSFGFYFWNSILCLSHTFYPTYLRNFGVTAKQTSEHYKFCWKFWVGILAIILCGILAHIGYSFEVFWFCLFILPWCNLHTVTQELSNRYVYVALIGLCVMLTHMLGPHVYLVIVYYGTRMRYVMRAYESRDRFLDYQLYYDPHSSRPYIFKSYKYLLEQKHVLAYYWAHRGVVLFPDDCDMNIIAARTSAHLTLKEESMKHLNVAYNTAPQGLEENVLRMIKDIEDLNASN